MREMIGEAQRRTLATVNSELVRLYWRIGGQIVAQQEHAAWGDAIVEQLSTDLRRAFPKFKGLSRDNLFRMRRFYTTCRETNEWLYEGGLRRLKKARASSSMAKVGTLSPQTKIQSGSSQDLAAELGYPGLTEVVLSLSWSHHYKIFGSISRPDERYFYMSMSVRERWSVRELQRQIDSDLFTRFVSVRKNAEMCLPRRPERGGLLPFKNHYVLDFLGLQDLHTERQLRKAWAHSLPAWQRN